MVRHLGEADLQRGNGWRAAVSLRVGNGQRRRNGRSHHRFDCGQRRGHGRSGGIGLKRQLAQHGANLRDHLRLGFRALAVSAQFFLQHVFGLQKNIHHLGAQRQLAMPRAVQQVL